MQRILIKILVSCLFTVNAYGQQKMTLEDIFSIIQKNHPEMKMYDAQIRSLNEAAKGAKSWSPPEFGAGLWMTPYNFNRAKASAIDKGRGSFMISVSQMFPNRKEQNANAEYLQALSSVNKENKKVSLNELFAEAKKNYYDWLVIKKKQTVLNDNEKLLNFIIQSTELRYKNNLGKLNSYYKAKAEIGKIENQREALNNQVEQKKIQLNTLMTQDKNEDFEIDTNFTIKNYTSTDTNYLIGARSDIKAVEQELKVNQLQLNLEKAKQLPQFGVQYSHMFSFGQNPWIYTLMATVKIPLAPWSAGSYKARIESLKWKEQSFEAQKQVIINEASGQAESLLSSINSKKKQLQLFEENIIPALKKNYQVMQLAYEQNTGELFELFDAWQTLNMTQLDYLDQLQQLLDLQVQMDKILEQK
ncbi:MAG TPA: TolC family protein [Hanamia sp.]|jgi:outer membrane protein TolC|nr:TolC family protein [Hanamia sp.]